MALRAINSTSWSEEILEVAREYFNGVIDVFIPATLGKYDPVTDERTGEGYVPEQVLIGARQARIQQLQTPREQSGSYEWSTKRRYRFQVELLTNDPVIHKGAMVRVRDGGRDSQLEDYVYQVTSASNSSHAALRTIETVTEFGGAS